LGQQQQQLHTGSSLCEGYSVVSVVPLRLRA